MRGPRSPKRTTLGAFTLASLLVAAPAGAAQYAPVRELGFLPGGSFSSGAAMSDGKTIVGVADAYGTTAGFTWSSAGGVSRALAAACASGSANDVNGVGLVVGTCSLADGTARAYTWRSGQSGALLALPTGGTESAAQSVNDQGVVAGSVSRIVKSYGLTPCATIWDANGQPRALPLPTNASSSVAAEVGPTGDAVGQVVASDPSGVDRMQAVVWPAAGGMQVLSRPAGHDDASALGIDAAGNVVGYTMGFGTDGNFEIRGQLWKADGTRVDLGFLPGGRYTVPLDVNDLGEVVGYALDAAGASHAFVWSQAGGLRALDAQVGVGGTASAIASDGSITGTRVRSDGAQVAYLLEVTVPTTPPPGGGDTGGGDTGGGDTGGGDTGGGDTGGGDTGGGDTGGGDTGGGGTTTPPTYPNDTTAPHSTATLTPAPNRYGWNRTDVSVAIDATDAESGVREIRWNVNGAAETATAGAHVDLELSGEGEWPVGFHAVDNAGNVEAANAVPVRIDMTAPLLLYSFSTGATNGWFREPVTIRFRAVDGLSGVATVSAPVTVSAPGETTVVGSASDKAGNVTNVSVPVRMDSIPPTVSVSQSTTGLWPPNHQMVDVRFTGRLADAQSGPRAVRVEVTSSEPDDERGDGAFTGDVGGRDGYARPVTFEARLDARGNYDVTVPLRAERSGIRGRSYRVTVRGEDGAGNTVASTTEVKVLNSIQLRRR